MCIYGFDVYRHVVRALQQSREAVLALKDMLKYCVPHMEVTAYVTCCDDVFDLVV